MLVPTGWIVGRQWSPEWISLGLQVWSWEFSLLVCVEVASQVFRLWSQCLMCSSAGQAVRRCSRSPLSLVQSALITASWYSSISVTITTALYWRDWWLDTGWTKGLAVAGDCEGMHISIVFSWKVNRMVCTLCTAVVTRITSTYSLACRGNITADHTWAHDYTLSLLAGIHDGHVILWCRSRQCVINNNWIRMAYKVQLEFVLTLIFYFPDMTRLAVFMYECGVGLERILVLFWCHELIHFICQRIVEGPLIPREGMAFKQLLSPIISLFSWPSFSTSFSCWYRGVFRILMYISFMSTSFYIIVFYHISLLSTFW